MLHFLKFEFINQQLTDILLHYLNILIMLRLDDEVNELDIHVEHKSFYGLLSFN